MRFLRAARAAPLALVAWLTACTGASTGSVDPNAPSRYGDQAQSFAVNNGKLIVAIVLALAGATFLAWLWRSPVTKIVLALVVGGSLVYFAMKGGR